MKKTIFLFVLTLKFHFIFSQTLIKESIIQEKQNDAKFYSSIAGNFPPKVTDGGGNIFVIEYMGKFLGCTHDLSKKWEVSKHDLAKLSKPVAIGYPYRVANKTTLYDILYRKGRFGAVEIAVGVYNLEDGKSEVKVIPFSSEKGIYIVNFFALSDGLYFTKIKAVSKSDVAQYLCKLDNAGKISEIKLSLPFTDQETSDLVERDFDLIGNFRAYRLAGIQKDQILVFKGYVEKNKETKQYEAPVSFYTVDKTGEAKFIKEALINQPKDALALSVPTADIDTVNNIIYVSGYLIGRMAYNGVYHLSFDLSAEKEYTGIYPFETLNKNLNPKEKISIVPFTQTGVSDDFLISYPIYLEPDYYNKLCRVYLEQRFHSLSAKLHRYVYFTPESKIAEIAESKMKKGNPIEKNILYTDNTRKKKTGLDYHEINYPVDKNYFLDFYIKRNDYVILVLCMETNSKILIKKLSIK